MAKFLSLHRADYFEKIATLSLPARSLFFDLMMRYCDAEGPFTLHRSSLAATAGLAPQAVKWALEKLVADGLVVVDGDRLVECAMAEKGLVTVRKRQAGGRAATAARVQNRAETKGGFSGGSREVLGRFSVGSTEVLSKKANGINGGDHAKSNGTELNHIRTTIESVGPAEVKALVSLTPVDTLGDPRNAMWIRGRELFGQLLGADVDDANTKTASLLTAAGERPEIVNNVLETLAADPPPRFRLEGKAVALATTMAGGIPKAPPAPGRRVKDASGLFGT